MIIGISGKMNSGKDTFARVFQILDAYKNTNIDNSKIANMVDHMLKNPIMFDDCVHTTAFPTDWEIRKFSNKLKDIVCLLIGCTRKQLEDQDFKNKDLGPEWYKYNVKVFSKHDPSKAAYWINLPTFYFTEKEAQEACHRYCELYKIPNVGYVAVETTPLTPRLLLQIAGTKFGRNLIHPDIWVNSLLSEYNENSTWLITDVRFPNEAEAIKKKGGILLRIDSDRSVKSSDISETALDDYTDWKYKINNNVTKEHLINLTRTFYKNINDT